ncbi:MAG TPA: hypothetical protein VG711_11480 [Phycisphaerales bacterium]|nr:hypothetical protein [Phycisphaerales bacterium]
MHTPFTPRSILTTTLIASVAALSFASSASAQNALGNGDALDANLSTRGRYNAPTPQEDFRARNDIVTGNVAGGRGFRGTVGYTAERDFRGVVGSDALFRFLADSAWSDPTLYSFGERYDQLRYGQSMGILQYDRPTTIPTPALGSGSTIITSPDISLSAARMRVNQYTISQTQVEQDKTAYQPRWISGAQDKYGNKFVFTASPARGFTYEFVDPVSSIPGLTMMDRARLEQDQELERQKNKQKAKDDAEKSPVGSSFETRFDNLADDTRTDVTADQQAFASTINNNYKKILEHVADQFTQLENKPETTQDGSESGDKNSAGDKNAKPAPNSTEELQKRYDEWRKRLQNSGKPNTQKNSSDNPLENSDLEDAQSPDGEKKSNASTDPGKDLASQLEDFSKMISHHEVIDRYSADHPDRFNELVGQGESQLRAGQYFQAERTFMRALQITPDQPMALAGMANAQLGAGVYATASATLHSLFSSHPEMIDARYAPALLPSERFLTQAKDSLSAAITAGQTPADNGLVLAYIGHLTNDAAAIKQGVDAIAKAAPDDALAPLLDKLWLHPAPEPASAPDSGEKSGN